MEAGQEGLDDRDPRVLRERRAEPATLVVPGDAVQVDHHGRTETREGADLGFLGLQTVDAMQVGPDRHLALRPHHLIADEVERGHLDRGAGGETLDGAEEGELRREQQQDEVDEDDLPLAGDTPEHSPVGRGRRHPRPSNGLKGEAQGGKPPENRRPRDLWLP